MSVLFLSGCKSTLLVHDATVKDIAIILEDYAGTHGYKMTYRNDDLGSYRLSLGNFYVPESSQTTKSKLTTQQTQAKDSNLPLTAYEETTWNSVSVPGHYVEATAMVNLTQQDKNVVLSVDTSDVVGSSLGDISDYIKGFGYTVDNK